MKNLLILVALILNLFCYSQVSISLTGTDPDNSAGLDINFTDKGLLIPRVSLTSTTSTSPISGTPATSLLVYNTASQNDVTPGYYYWNGSKWVRLPYQNCQTPMYVLKTGNSYNVTCSQIYDNAVNVGINTTNPQAKLHVESGQFLTRNENNWSNHVSYVFSNTHHPAWVGVRARGTYTNPQEPQSGDILAHFTGRGIGDPWLNYGGAEITIVAEENFTLSNRGASIHFNTTTNGTNNPTRKMILTNNGMLGIGENYYPQFPLDVKGSARLNNMQTDGARLIWRGGVNGSQEYRARVGTNGQLGFFPIEIGNPGYVGEPLVLTQNGRVGINNMQNPQYPLHIGSNGATNTTLLAMSDNSRTFTIQLGNNLGWASNNNGVVYFEIPGDETYVMGGHTMPDLNGTRDLGSWNNHWWYYTYSYYYYTMYDYYYWSDIKLKENIESIKYGLNEILQLKPVFFNFKDDKNKKKQIGLIAQEVQQVIPELVNKHEESGYLSIDYSKFVPVLINAIKDLKKEIDELKEENKTLNEKLKQLQTK